MTIAVTQPGAGVPPLAIAVTDLPTSGAGTVTGIVQRSTDGGVRWTTVRGLAQAVITAGALATVDDYEFRPGVANSYRAGIGQILDTFSRTETDSWGDTDTGQTWGPTGDPALDVGSGVGTVVHDTADTTYSLLLDDPTDAGDIDLSVSVRLDQSNITGAEVLYGTLLHYIDSGNCYQLLVTTDAAESVTVSAVSRINDVAQTLATAALGVADPTVNYRLRVRQVGQRLRAKLWDPAAAPEPDWQIDITVPAARAIAAGQVGLYSSRPAGNTNDGLTITWDDLVIDIGRPQWIGGTANITPTLTGPWLCSTMRSFLNTPIVVSSYVEPGRTARGGATAVAGRTVPIGQAEVMTGRTMPLVLRAADVTHARALEYLLASGDVLWLLVPAGSQMPGGYYQLPSGQQMTADHARSKEGTRWLSVPLSEVAAPGPDIVTAQSTWDTVIASYGTWADVVAAVPTWEDLLDLVGDPAEVIVDQ